MHIPKRKKYQLLVVVVEEVQLLAREFGLHNDIAIFSEFKQSLITSEQSKSLVQILDEFDKNLKKEEIKLLEKVFDQKYEEKQHLLSMLICCVFNINIRVADLQKIIEPPSTNIESIAHPNNSNVSFEETHERVIQYTRRYIAMKWERAKEKTAGNLFMVQPQDITNPVINSLMNGGIRLKSSWFSQANPLSFYHVPTAELRTSMKLSPSGVLLKSALRKRTSSSAKRVQFNETVGVKEDASLADYFDDIFNTNRERAKQLVIALAKVKDNQQFACAVYLLNKASDASHLNIIDVLTDVLNDDELFELFKQLFRLESTINWGSDNKLLYLFLYHFMLSPENIKFKDMVWKNFSALIPLITHFDLQQAPLEIIQTIQSIFYKAVEEALNPKNFPELMQDIVNMAWRDLKSRASPQFPLKTQLRMLVGFIIIRFVNPIIVEKANTLSEVNIKWWFKTIIPASIKIWSTPIGSHENTINAPNIQETLFNPITKNKYLRNNLFLMVFEWLRTNNKTEKPGRQEVPLFKAPIEQCHQQLSEILQQEQFSGLSFKRNGLVKPAHSTSRTSIITFNFFAPIENVKQSDAETKIELIPIV